MITISVTSDVLRAHAEKIMADEVITNPNLNGARYEIVEGEYDEIDGNDPILTAQLYAAIFCADS